MRGGLLLICVLFALPFLAAAGHDIYLAYQEDKITIDKPFETSDLGWLWVRYSPETYDWSRENISPGFRDAVVDPLLQQTAMVVTAIPAAILYLFLFIAKMLGMWPFGERRLFGGGDKKGYAFKGVDQKKKQMRYKRK